MTNTHHPIHWLSHKTKSIYFFKQIKTNKYRRIIHTEEKYYDKINITNSHKQKYRRHVSMSRPIERLNHPGS